MNRLQLIILIFAFPFCLSAQTKVSGFVKDAETGELLIGATIVEDHTTNGTSTNSNGYLSLITEEKPITFSFIGYSSRYLIPGKDTVVTILLRPGQELEEILVNGNRFQRFNTTTLSTKDLMSIPAIGGKPDVLKTLQLMPGVQAQAEGTSLLNVRGGNPGENLYLIDDVPLIYVNHLGGFLSVFNPDMINDIEVYKNGFPAKYGGKLSSIMAIAQREGNKKDWKGNLGLGVTDASFSIEGPLIKDKASIIVTGRKTFIDLFMYLASSQSGGNEYFTFYGFHDINGKVSYNPDTKNSYHLNFYQGDDYLQFWSKQNEKTNEQAKIRNIWGNWLLSGRWSRIVSSRLFVNNILSFTNYRLKVAQKFTSNAQGDSIDYSSLYLSSVNDLSLRSDWQFNAMKNFAIEFGVKLTRLTYMPNYIFQSNDNHGVQVETVHSYENSVYLNNRFTLLNFLDAGIGISMVDYLNAEFSQRVWEPRIDLNARLAKSHTINFSFQSVNQFAHLLFTSGAIMNNEIWVPADKTIRPSQSMQYSVGWKGEFAKGMFSAELNFYHKTLTKLATYKEGYSNLLGDGSWRTKIETGGAGESNGIEFLFRKSRGEWTGFAGYTYSKTTRQFSGVNRGNEYLFDYDRPHSFTLNINRRINEKWEANFVWVYQTGLPYTPVLGRQYIPDGYGGYEEALIYGQRNSSRMKDYHRLDLGFTYKKKTKHGRNALLTFSVYNAYNHHNPNSYYYASGPDNTKTYDWQGNYQPLKLYQVSFFPLIPTVSYKVFFGE